MKKEILKRFLISISIIILSVIAIFIFFYLGDFLIEKLIGDVSRYPLYNIMCSGLGLVLSVLIILIIYGVYRGIKWIIYGNKK